MNIQNLYSCQYLCFFDQYLLHIYFKRIAKSMMNSMISPQKAALLEDPQIFEQIKGQLTARSIQSYQKAKKQFLKKRGQVITNLNNLNSEDIAKSCDDVLANAIKEMIEDRQKQQKDFRMFYKILEEKLKERNQAEHPLYQIRDMQSDIESEVKRVEVNGNLADISSLNKQNQSENRSSNTLNIKIQNKNINMPILAQKSKVNLVPLPPKQNSRSKQDSNSDDQQMHLNDDQIGGKSRNQAVPNQQKQATLPVVKKAEESKYYQAKEPNKIINNIQLAVQNKKEIKTAQKNKSRKKDSSSDSDFDDLNDGAIHNAPSKQKQGQTPSKIENNHLNKVQMIKPKEQKGNEIDNSNNSKNQLFTAKDEKKQTKKIVEQKKQPIKSKQTFIAKKQNKKCDSDDELEMISEEDFHKACKSSDKKGDQILPASKPIKNDPQSPKKTIVKQVEKNNQRVGLPESKQDKLNTSLRDSPVGGIKKDNIQNMFSKLQTNEKQKSTSIFGGVAVQKKSIFENVFVNKGTTIFTQPEGTLQLKQTNPSSNNQANKSQSIFSNLIKSQIKDQQPNIFGLPATNFLSASSKTEKQPPENKLAPANLFGPSKGNIFGITLDTAKSQAPKSKITSPSLFGGSPLNTQNGGLFGNSILK